MHAIISQAQMNHSTNHELRVVWLLGRDDDQHHDSVDTTSSIDMKGYELCISWTLLC